MAKRHDDALIIQGGACNVSRIVRALSEAVAEVKEEGQLLEGCEYYAQDPAVRLILHQLCHLARMSTDSNPAHWPRSFDWDKDVNLCFANASDSAKAIWSGTYGKPVETA